MIIDVQGKPAYCYTGGKPFDATLPTAVFIHGAQNDHSVWVLQTRYFAHHGFSVLAVDLPGHGRSSGPALASVEAMTDWLLALLEAAGVREPATLIGHSMGSLIAIQAAAQAPGRVARVALVGTAYPMKVSDMLLDAARDAEQTAIDMVTIWSHASIAQKPSCPGPGFSVVGGSRRLMQQIARQPRDDDMADTARTETPEAGMATEAGSAGAAGQAKGNEVFLTDFKACNAYANGEAAARTIRCPALLLLGANDQMTPPKATAVLRSALPHHQLVVVPRCGHSLMAEQPDAVLDALFGFSLAPAGAAVR